ncbi:hypothetical protein LOTGIDRAFT_237658 [Lottia gigantea]|uniref:Cytochrome P450 n=1 Tax=Lottia gigantea TaxID=225164 RepID=V4CMI2_LOTGI|nr:hypothetical protein LOTGIDRAFT_237658 [Lottia gigantea]ESP03555.1 hypothetical protein LOTGIDRAFT_237658 [Lottia gigantea]
MEEDTTSISWRIGYSIFGIYLVYKLILGLKRFIENFKFFNQLPGETDFHWIWGNLHKLSRNTEERMAYVKELLKKYPRFYRTWLTPFKPVINLSHPETVKVLLKTSEPKPRGFGASYEFALPWLGDGLLLAGGKRWARSRRLLTPAFHFDILKPYVTIYNEAADILIEKIDKFAENGESFEIFSLISQCTLDVILRCAMSYKGDIQRKGETHPYNQAVNELSELWFDRGRQPWLYFDTFYYMTKDGKRFREQCNYVHSVSEEIIEKRRKTLETEGPNKKQRYLDFLDILLTAKDENGVGLTPLEIRNEVDTFLFEGHDTTASAISWILYSLSTHPLYQQQVFGEVENLVGDRECPNIKWNDLPKLEYLSRVIKEGMRLHCPVPFAQRELTQDTVIDGHLFPKETHCSIHILNLHHNPLVWSDPWEFQPDRFLPENMQNLDSYAFVPFSAGPRNCIGQHFAMDEEKVLLSRIIQRYQLKADPDHLVQRKVAAVMRAENGIRMFATRR